MMFAAFTAEGDSSSRCSTASPSAEPLGCYSSPVGSVSSLGSPQCQDFADLTASCASFVPTVTAISTCPDLQWMVQPLISSVAPSQRAHPYSSAPAYPRQASKALKRSRADQVSAEEEEKRRIRRERNKQAAAKCRNRRRELTDTLQAETDQLEDEKSTLQNDIANLLKEKERLEFILAAHRPVCKLEADFSVAPGGSTPAPTSTSNSIFSCTSSSVLSTVSTSSAVKMSDLEASVLEESLDLLSGGGMDTARSVPEVDLSLYAPQDWELLPSSSSSSDLEPLSTPVVTCTPACSTYTSSFVFSFPEADGCGAAHRRGSSSNEPSSDSLSSPTLLAL